MISFSVSAQKLEKHEKMAKKQTAQWTEVCELTQEQSDALLPILSNKNKEILKVKEAYADNQEKLKEEKKAINKIYAPKIKEAVGQENVKKMHAYYKKKREEKKK